MLDNHSNLENMILVILKRCERKYAKIQFFETFGESISVAQFMRVCFLGDSRGDPYSVVGYCTSRL